jgi:hypothetical protein
LKQAVSKPSLEELELIFDSEFPTARAPESAALAARLADKAWVEADGWFDSEAPTGVAAERPVLPRPPRAPEV